MEDESEESKPWGERQVRRISVMHGRDHENLNKNGSSTDRYCEKNSSNIKIKGTGLCDHLEVSDKRKVVANRDY